MFDVAATTVSLAHAKRGDRGVIVKVGGVLHSDELERRLLEIGFVEGAQVSVLHEGPWGRDPIAVKVDDTRVALRRREAHDILLRLETAPPVAA
ncbi:FeoA family protein [soil metagenome]